jgi:hypothetical protein
MQMKDPITYKHMGVNIQFYYVSHIDGIKVYM